MLEDERINLFDACKADLEKLSYLENKTRVTNLEDIQDKIDTLINMHESVVVYDPVEDTIELEDAIAIAMLKSIYYRRKGYHRSCAEELKWCLVRCFCLIAIEILMWQHSDLEQSRSR